MGVIVIDNLFFTGLAAVGAGVLTFFSPCIFPLIPAYICFITGLSIDELKLSQVTLAKKKLILAEAVAFVLGFSLVFIALGTTASFLAVRFLSFKKIIRLIGGIVIILFGLHISGILKIKFLNYQRKIHLKTKPTSCLGSFLVGMAFGFGWSPCVGPLLGGILMLAATGETLSRGIILLGFYSLGLAVPFLLVSIAISRFLFVLGKIGKYLKPVAVISGVLLIIVGISILIPPAEGASFLPNSEGNQAIRKPAAEFTLTGIDGASIKLADFKDKVVILNFWAMYCPACREQLPVLIKVYEQYQQKGLAVIGISLDRADDVSLKKFAQEKKITYPLSSGNQELIENYGGITFIPTTFIIDKQTRIVKKIIGPVSLKDLQAEFEPLLSE